MRHLLFPISNAPKDLGVGRVGLGVRRGPGCMTSGFYSARNPHVGFPNLSSVISSYLAGLQARARNTFFVADAVSLWLSLTFPQGRVTLGEEELKDRVKHWDPCSPSASAAQQTTPKEAASAPRSSHPGRSALGLREGRCLGSTFQRSRTGWPHADAPVAREGQRGRGDQGATGSAHHNCGLERRPGRTARRTAPAAGPEAPAPGDPLISLQQSTPVLAKQTEEIYAGLGLGRAPHSSLNESSSFRGHSHRAGRMSALLQRKNGSCLFPWFGAGQEGGEPAESPCAGDAPFLLLSAPPRQRLALQGPWKAQPWRAPPAKAASPRREAVSWNKTPHRLVGTFFP